MISEESSLGFFSFYPSRSCPFDTFLNGQATRNSRKERSWFGADRALWSCTINWHLKIQRFNEPTFIRSGPFGGVNGARHRRTRYHLRGGDNWKITVFVTLTEIEVFYSLAVPSWEFSTIIRPFEKRKSSWNIMGPWDAGLQITAFYGVQTSLRP